MNLEGKLVEVEDRANSELEPLEGRQTETSNVSRRSELGYCPRCFELEEKFKKAEERCDLLELEIERKKREFELLESKVATVVLDERTVEDEVHLFEKGKKELENKITCVKNCNMAIAEEIKGPQDVDAAEEGDKVFELMMENNALNAEIGVWETKCKDLELRVAELEKSLYSKNRELTGMANMDLLSSIGGKEISGVNELQGPQGAATPVVHTLSSNLADVDAAEKDILHENNMGYGSRARKQLVFEEGTPTRKMAPVTPASTMPLPICPIDISDSDDEANTTKSPGHDIQATKKVSGLADSVGVVSMGGKELPSKNISIWSPNQSDEDDVLHYKKRASCALTAKRKRTFKVVTSDSGSDTDDNFPICRLRRDNPDELGVPSLQKSNYWTAAASEIKNGKPVPRRHLVPLRKQCKEGASKKSYYSNLQNIETQSLRGISTYGTCTTDETEEDESDAEDESLDGFIVGDSDSEGVNASKGNDTSNGRSAGESDDASDSNMEYGDIISRIGRRKDHLMKWVFEADMLAAFGKYPELCMKAVCALYRKQTSEEKFSKSTIFSNQRGFSQCDAIRGSILGEFLTDGDPLGDLKKSAEELQEYDPKGVELCRTLATHYSKQLFAMYENKEDPLWPALGSK